MLKIDLGPKAPRKRWMYKVRLVPNRMLRSLKYNWRHNKVPLGLGVIVPTMLLVGGLVWSSWGGNNPNPEQIAQTTPEPQKAPTPPLNQPPTGQDQNEKANPAPAPPAKAKANDDGNRLVRVAKLRAEKVAPFREWIDFEYELTTGGDSVEVRIPTVHGYTVLKYGGKKVIDIPPNTQVKGWVYIIPLYPDQKVTVQVREVVWEKGR